MWQLSGAGLTWMCGPIDSIQQPMMHPRCSLRCCLRSGHLFCARGPWLAGVGTLEPPSAGYDVVPFALELPNPAQHATDTLAMSLYSLLLWQHVL